MLEDCPRRAVLEDCLPSLRRAVVIVQITSIGQVWRSDVAGAPCMATARLSRETANEMGTTTKSLGRTKTFMIISEPSKFTCNVGYHVQQPIEGYLFSFAMLMWPGCWEDPMLRYGVCKHFSCGMFVFTHLSLGSVRWSTTFWTLFIFSSRPVLSNRRFNLFTWIALPELHSKNTPSGEIWACFYWPPWDGGMWHKWHHTSWSSDVYTQKWQWLNSSCSIDEMPYTCWMLHCIRLLQAN